MKVCLYVLMLSSFLSACKSGPFSLIKPSSPHEQYESRLINAGLDKNTMGQRWIAKAKLLLADAKQIKIPYKETGYFAAEKIEGAAFKFILERGQMLNVSLSKQSSNDFIIYLDLWEQKENGEFKKLAFADSTGTSLQWEAKQSRSYILRLQPELLGSGSYTLELQVGPSLAFPLKNTSRKQVQSFFGVGRDNNTRRHEGVDIFSSFRTPVLAAADGIVTRVNENNLGGRVVWLRPKGKDYTLYYAHLDEQIAVEGKEVSVGDTLGLMGNTGNAKTTPPHLHFGVYASGGALDPLPFIDPQVLSAAKISSDASKLNTTLRTLNKTVEMADSEQFLNSNSLKQHTIVRVLAATSNQYKIELPNGKVGYVNAKSLVDTKPLNARKIANTNQNLYDNPSLSAGVKRSLAVGQTVNVLGNFEDFQLVATAGNEVGWITLK